jgi:hypothetical protein
MAAQQEERALLKPLLIAGTTALLVLLGAEGVARGVMGVLPLPHSYTHPRNLMLDRGWVAYTAPRLHAADEKLIILIANSQGYGREMGDPQQIYAAHLQRRLNAADRSHRYRVANWSMNGGIAPDMVLLAARAAAHTPEAVLFVTYRHTVLDVRSDYPAYFSNRNLQYLGYEPSVRRLLSKPFLRRYSLSRPLGWLTSASSLLQLHHLFMVPGHKGVIGRVQAQSRASTSSAAPSYREQPWHPRGEEMLWEMHDTLRRGLPAVPMAFVSMPIDLSLMAPENRNVLRSYAPRLQAMFFGRPGVHVWDGVEAIPQASFYSNTHFTAEGHAQFGDWLFDRVQPLVRPTSAAAPD